MNILEIGQNIYNLRKAKKITQEELSKVVGVSVAAVSKWEVGASYPDITLLPVIANFFDISIDQLMSHNYSLTDEDIEKIGMECMESFNNGEDKGFSFCNKYIRKYTKAYKLKLFLASIILINVPSIDDKETRDKRYLKALGIYEDIISNCSDDEILETAILSAGNMYSYLEDYDRALEVYKKVKSSKFSIDVLIASAYLKQEKYKEARKLLQESLMFIIGNIDITLGQLAMSYKHCDREKAEKYLEFKGKILRAFEREENYSDVSYKLEIIMESGTESEQIEVFKEFLQKVKDMDNMFKFEEGKPWYLDETNLNMKAKDNKLLNKLNMKSTLIKSINQEEKYKSLLEKEEIKVIMDNIID